MNAIFKTPAHERFNNLSKGDQLAHFEWFEIMPCRADDSEGGTVTCEAGEAEFWTIYGERNTGTSDNPAYEAMAIHDAFNVLELVRLARLIVIETGKGFVAGDVHYGRFPKKYALSVPVTEFTAIAEDLTFAIYEDIECEVLPEDRRDDDFDNHPLAELREAFVEFSNYSGSDQRDPFAPIQEEA